MIYNMELICVVIGVMLLLKTIIGYQRGFIAEASSIIGLILGLIAALAFQPSMALAYCNVCKRRAFAFSSRIFGHFFACLCCNCYLGKVI